MVTQTLSAVKGGERRLRGKKKKKSLFTSFGGPGGRREQVWAFGLPPHPVPSPPLPGRRLREKELARLQALLGSPTRDSLDCACGKAGRGGC